MHMTKQIGVLAIALTVAAATPASAQNREHQQLAADGRMVQEQLQQLTISLTALSQTLAESIKAINARLDTVNESTRKGFADQKLLVDNLGNDVRVVRERSDESNVRIAGLTSELQALRDTVLELQRAAAAAAAAVQPAVPVDPNAPPPDPNAPPAPAPPVAAPPAPSIAGVSPQRLFSEAQIDYYNSRYAVAISGFEGFVRSFPRDPNADDAYFLIGESHAAEKRFPEAIAAYNQVIQNYRGTNAVPDSYYKLGLAQDQSGQRDAARASWEALIKQFPDSSAAGLAKQALDRVNRAQQP
jgi:tol-pal system protein YbgF